MKLYNILICSLMLCSCSNNNFIEEPEYVDVSISYSLRSSYESGSMTRLGTVSKADSIFTTVFEPLFEDGTLLNDSIYLRFEDSQGYITSIRGNKKDTYSIKTGIYTVTGTIGVDNDNYRKGGGNKATFDINISNLKITPSTTNIILNGKIREALVFSENSMMWGDSGYSSSTTIQSEVVDDYHYLFCCTTFNMGSYSYLTKDYYTLEVYDYTMKFDPQPNNYYYFPKNAAGISYSIDMTNGFETTN